MPVHIHPDGKIGYTSKPKARSGNSSHDSRQQKLTDLKNKVRELEEQKEELLNQYHDVNNRREQTVDEFKNLRVKALKWKQQTEQTEDKYEDLKKQYEVLEKQYGELEKRSDRKTDDINQKERMIRQKDKQLEELHDDKKFQSGVIKKLEDQDVMLRERTTTLIEERRMHLQEIALRKANDEKQLAENKKLKDENARLLDWLNRERQQALDKERRDAERHSPRRRYDDEFSDDGRSARPMPNRPRNR